MKKRRMAPTAADAGPAAVHNPYLDEYVKVSRKWADAGTFQDTVHSRLADGSDTTSMVAVLDSVAAAAEQYAWAIVRGYCASLNG